MPPQPKWKDEGEEQQQHPTRFTMGYWQMRGLGAVNFFWAKFAGGRLFSFGR